MNGYISGMWPPLADFLDPYSFTWIILDFLSIASFGFFHVFISLYCLLSLTWTYSYIENILKYYIENIVIFDLVGICNVIFRFCNVTTQSFQL